MQEALEETKCGVMRSVGQLDPKALFVMGIAMYMLSVVQIGGM